MSRREESNRAVEEVSNQEAEEESNRAMEVVSLNSHNARTHKTTTRTALKISI